MLLRVKQDTTQPLDHPYRVPVPTWGLVAEDPITETMIIQVPDDQLPDSIRTDDSVKVIHTYRGDVVTAAADSVMSDWHKLLQERYPEHHGEFLPALAP